MQQPSNLGARIAWRAPLSYRDGADAGSDRPAHIRAASALAWVGGRLVIVQDDANFLALVQPGGNAGAAPVMLPAGHEGRRQFDANRGNKAHKLDLESCVTFGRGADIVLVAFGSGSTAARERIIIASGFNAPVPRVEVIAANRLYAALRGATEFAGAELNIEGAVLIDERELTLFGRGNGAARGGREPVNATCTLEWGAVHAYLRDLSAPVPHPHSIRTYDLGAIDGIPLGFTDAVARDDGILFSAAAEASPDVVQDGRVAGSVIGCIPREGPVRSFVVHDEHGAPFIGKIEGLAVAADDGTIYAVADEDDPERPSELCVITLDTAALR